MKNFAPLSFCGEGTMDAGTLIDDLFAVVKKAERDTKRTAAPNGEPHDAGLQPSPTEKQPGVDPTSKA
jgi:hypothetical protein